MPEDVQFTVSTYFSNVAFLNENTLLGFNHALPFLGPWVRGSDEISAKAQNSNNSGKIRIICERQLCYTYFLGAVVALDFLIAPCAMLVSGDYQVEGCYCLKVKVLRLVN